MSETQDPTSALPSTIEGATRTTGGAANAANENMNINANAALADEPMPETSTADRGLGSLIRMRALPPTELPKHPDLASQQSNASLPDLTAFISEALDEAHWFMTTYLPKNFKTKDSSKPSPPSAASVQLLVHEVPGSEIPPDARPTTSGSGKAETWFARSSTHENVAKDGTASWDEFDGGLRANHSQHEKEYTPDVYDANQVLSWNSELATNPIGSWSNVNMSIMEMVHHIPFPLSDRRFPVLVLTAKQAKEFLVVQIPVDIANVPAAKYNSDGKKVTGMYCSIERGELVEGGAKVKWQMATASDAKGSLPMFVQKMGTPPALVKDVGFFLAWCAKRRGAKA